MTKLIIQLIGLAFLLISFLMSIFNYGQTVIDTYESCHLCVKDNVEYRCNCEIINKYTGEPIEWFVILGIGITFGLVGFFYKK